MPSKNDFLMPEQWGADDVQGFPGAEPALGPTGSLKLTVTGGVFKDTVVKAQRQHGVFASDYV